MVNPLFFEYKLVCSHPGCFGKAALEQAMSAGWTLGSVIPEDPTNSDVGRCPVCKRHKMKVMNEPPPKKLQLPVGWTKIPSE
jgi:hypothetical protein